MTPTPHRTFQKRDRRTVKGRDTGRLLQDSVYCLKQGICIHEVSAMCTCVCMHVCLCMCMHALCVSVYVCSNNNFKRRDQEFKGVSMG